MPIVPIYTKQQQHGAALLLTIIFLLIISGIVVSGLSNKTLQTNLVSSFLRNEIGYQEAQSALADLYNNSQGSLKNLLNQCEKNKPSTLSVNTANTELIDNNNSTLTYLGQRIYIPKAGEDAGELGSQIEYVFELSTQATVNNTDNKIYSKQHQGIVWKTKDICSDNPSVIN